MSARQLTSITDWSNKLINQVMPKAIDFQRCSNK